MKLYKNYVVSTMIIPFIAVLLSGCEPPTTQMNTKPSSKTAITKKDTSPPPPQKNTSPKTTITKEDKAEGDQKSTIAVHSVQLDNTTLDLVMGSTKILKANIKPTNSTNQKVDWVSSDTTIATVDGNGEVTALKAGQATVTATTDDGDYTATCTVTVKPVSTKQELKNLIYKRMQVAGYNGNENDPGTDIDLNDIDISQLTELKSLFESPNGGGSKEPYLHHFNGDISNWDVSNVNDMYAMFYESEFNQDISNWKVDNVENMASMFSSSTFNQDISSWDVDNVTDMNNMFSNSPFNGDISNWKVSKVTDMSYMFSNCQFNQDISKWKVSISKVENMEAMFYDATNFDNGGNPDGLDGWRIAPTVDKVFMFYNSKLETNNNLPCWDDGDLSNCQNP